MRTRLAAFVLLTACGAPAPASPTAPPVTTPPALSDSGVPPPVMGFDAGPPPTGEQMFFAPGVDPSVATFFGGAENPTRAPQLVYPLEGALVPPNLNELELHFMPGPGNTVFQVVFQIEAFRITVFAYCESVGAGCAFRPEETVWRSLSEAARGRAPVSVTVRGSDPSGSGVGTSAARSISFAQEDILGGLYYWNAPSGQIQRYDFGLRGQRTETFLDRAAPARPSAWAVTR